jgi:predicted TIM-barrel enzyme
MIENFGTRRSFQAGAGMWSRMAGIATARRDSANTPLGISILRNDGLSAVGGAAVGRLRPRERSMQRGGGSGIAQGSLTIC